MELRRIGGLDVSVVGLGCNNFGMTIDADATRAVVDAALDAGITYFDTAESYGGGQSEEFLGLALRGRRDRALIASKWGFPTNLADGEIAGDPAIIRRSLEGTLRRLGTDHVDHYQLHRADPTTPDEEILGTLAELRAEGKIREIGCTHQTAAEIDGWLAASAASGHPAYASVQNHYSLLTRGDDTNGVLDRCRTHGLGYVPYFPLESGLLTGKYRLGRDRPADSRLVRWGARADAFIDDAKLAVVERLVAWADAAGCSLLDVALGSLVATPGVATVIAGATSPAQVRANVAAAAWRPDAAARAAVDALLVG